MTAVLGFPGQGVRWEAVVAALDAHSSAPAVGALASSLGTDDWAGIDPADTARAQPAIFAASVVAASTLDPENYALVIGHSFGELAALTLAGCLDIEEGARLAHLRGRLGAEANSVTPGAMLALLGLDADTAEWIRRRAIRTSGAWLETAVINHERQRVLAGDPAAVQAGRDLADEAGGGAVILPIGGAFHTPVMLDCYDEFREAAAGVRYAPPRIPVVLSSGGGAVSSADDLDSLPHRLARSLVMPVDWPDALSRARALGADQGWDGGPGDTLVRISRRAGMRFTSPYR